MKEFSSSFIAFEKTTSSDYWKEFDYCLYKSYPMLLEATLIFSCHFDGKQRLFFCTCPLNWGLSQYRHLETGLANFDFDIISFHLCFFKTYEK